MFHSSFFLIECVQGQNRFWERELFLSKLCSGCSPQNLPCLLQHTVLPLPLLFFLQLLRPISLSFLVPWVHNPVSFCMCHPATSLPCLSSYSVNFQLLVSLGSQLFGFYFIHFFFLSLACQPVWWVLNVCSIPTVSVHSVSLCHSNLQFLEGEILWGGSVQTVKPIRERIVNK